MLACGALSTGWRTGAGTPAVAMFPKGVLNGTVPQPMAPSERCGADQRGSRRGPKATSEARHSPGAAR